MSEHTVSSSNNVAIDSVSRKTYDVSLTIHPHMLVWPGDPPVDIEAAKSTARGDSSNVSLLRLGSHTGTHVDAPHHFIGGAPGVDNISPEVLLGRARLFQPATSTAGC